MSDKAVAATLIGAVIGGMAGYLFFTTRGRELRRQIEPALDDIARELNSFRGTVQRAANVANGGEYVIEGNLTMHGTPLVSTVTTSSNVFVAGT